MTTLSVISCRGDAEVERVAQVGQAASVDPQSPHDFSGLDPATHILPATARDHLPGAGEVGPDGSYHYSLPLDVPPGRGDVTPKLSLEYTSRSGNGPLGVGWSIGGLSAIHPCDAIISDFGNADPDEDADERMAAEGDSLCLDGARLESVGIDQYGTEQNMIAKIVRLPSDPTFAWKVFLKDHRIRYYYKAASIGSDGPVTYPLAEEHDRSGNFARYSYTNTSPRLIDKIEYTFHSDGSPARREIDFVWSDRPDKIKRRVSGEELRWDQRLTSIAMKAPKPSTKGAVWTYSIGYEASPETGYSRLTSVKRCATTDGCSYAREFGWSGRPDRFPAQSKAVNPGSSISDISPLLVFDFNGDGSDDLLYNMADGRTVVAYGASDVRHDPLGGILGSLYEISTIPYLNYARPVDLDGDGAVELVALQMDEVLVETADTQAKLQEAIHYVVLRWDEGAQDFIEDTSTRLPPEVATPAYDAFIDHRCGVDGPRCEPFFFLDVNGDGLADIVKARDLDLDRTYNPDRWEIYLNNAGDFRDDFGFVVPEIAPTALAAGQMVTYSETRYTTIHDGRQFLRFAKYFPDTSSAPMDVQRVGLRIDRSAQVIDVDNDRPADTLNVSETDSDGDGVRELRWGTSSDPWQAPRFDVMYSDIDRDGREDAVVHDTEAYAIEIHLSKTLADSPQPVYVLDQVLTHDRDLAKVTVGDFDGDTRPDIVAVESGSDGHMVLWRHFNEPNNYQMIAAHTDHLIHVREEAHAAPLEMVWYRNVAPIHNIHEPTWSPASELDLPEETDPCSAASYPTVCMKRGLTVVMQHRVAAPHAGDAAAMRTTGYSYFHPFADAHGRGFLGFRMIRTWEKEQATETEIWFRRNTERIRGRYPFAFVPEDTQIATLIEDVNPTGRNDYRSTGTARVKRILHHHEARQLGSGSTYLLLDELTEEFEWEEPVTVVGWSLPAFDVTNHIDGIDRMDGRDDGPMDRTHVVDPTYDNYGNVIAQVATTTGGVTTEFTMGYKPADKTMWLVSLPADYRYRSWTPSLHPQPPQMRHVRYEHDILGRLTTQWNEPTSTDNDLKQTIEYQREPTYGKYGQITGVLRTAPGADGGTRFDGLDWRDLTGEQIFPAQTWNGLSHTTVRVYHPAYGVVVAEADPNDVVTLYSYDDLGRVRKIDPEASEVVTLSYEEAGETQRVTTSTESTARRTTTYDRLGRPIEQTVLGMDGVDDVSSISFDALGHVYQISNWGKGAPATAKTSRTYDTLGRARVVTRPDGSTIESAYQGLFETKNFDAKGARRRVIRDKDQRVVEMYAEVDGTEQKSSIIYKPFDLPGFMIDADNNQTEFGYDLLGRKREENDPNTGYATRSFNGFGELRRDQRGSDVTVYHRDVLGRVTSMNTVDGVVSFDYDDAPGGFSKGKMWSETSADGTLVTYRFDDAGRPKGSTWTTSTGEGFDIDVERDALGRVVKTHYPTVGGKRLVIENVFSGAYMTKIVDVSDPASMKPVWKVTDRSPDGALRTAEYGDSVAYFQADYDAMGQPRRIQAYRTPSSFLADLRYAPDANGNIERREDVVEGRVENFKYDELNRLRTWKNQKGSTTVAREYQYDRIGNIKTVLDGSTVTEEYTYLGAAGPQKLASSTGMSSYQYDARGRQVRKGNRRISYTAFDQPRTVNVDFVTTTYQYTASGERVRKLGFGSESIYIDRLYERHKLGSSTTHVQHVYGPDGAVADIVDNATGRHVTYVVGDAIGSTTVRFDNTTVLDRRHFDPWGRRIQADGANWTGTWSETKIGFTGAEQDDFGLINMGGRMYDPSQRRFVSPDPLVVSPYFDQAWNRYSYVYNNPATLTDPTGYYSGYVSPAWLCGYDPYFFQFASVSYAPGSGGPPPGQWTRTSPDVTRTSFQSSASLSGGPQFSGTGYANGQPVARWLIDHGVDAWLQENGDTAINVSLGVSYAMLTAATWGMAVEAGVFVGMSEKIASIGATSWRTIVGVSGAIGEGVRRYGTQVTRWGAQLSSGAQNASTAAPSVPQGVTARVTTDPGLAQFVNRLESVGIKVTNTNVSIMGEGGRIMGEVDVVVENALIQFKNGPSSARAVIDQVVLRTEPFVSRPVITFINDTGRAGARTVSGAGGRILITNDFQTLVDVLR